jgi:hypothetical protein
MRRVRPPWPGSADAKGTGGPPAWGQGGGEATSPGNPRARARRCGVPARFGLAGVEPVRHRLGEGLHVGRLDR